VLSTILALGLWPFHVPRNAVVWLGSHDGLLFGKYGTVISTRPFKMANTLSDPTASLEIWLQPQGIWNFGTFLSFSRPENLGQFSLHQFQTNLQLDTSSQNGPDPPKKATLYVRDVFRKSRPVFIAITSGEGGTSVYTDGALVAVNPAYPRFAERLSGQLIIGDSPAQPDSWRGRLLGLAIYHRQLAAEQVLRHYSSWKQTGRPRTDGDDFNVALYLFDEHAGNVVRDKAGAGVDLYIPERYQVIEKAALQPFWTEFSMSWAYWRAALKNIVGFIPLGFCFYAYLTTLVPMKRAAIFTVAAGTAVSLTIEALQAFLPTRDSGTTDIITNTIGAWIGVATYQLLAPALARFSSRLSVRITR
jgi:VanZ family protein